MSVAERREARKRRILENLDNRMQKITGVTNNIENENEPYNNETQFLTSTPLLSNKIEENPFPDQEHIKIPSPYPSLSNQNVAVNSESSIIQKILFNTELQIIFIAVLSYSLLRYNAGFLVYESLMVPFYTLEMVQVSFNQKDGKSNVATVLITILGMYGISNRIITVAAKVLLLAFSVGKDLCLYLFVIILTANILG